MPQRDRCLLYLTLRKVSLEKTQMLKRKLKTKKGDSGAVSSGLLFVVFCC